MATPFRGWTSQGTASRLALALAALVLCGNTVAAPMAAYSNFHGLLHDVQTGEQAGTFSGSFHYDLSDDTGGSGGGADGLPDHMAATCASAADLTAQGCVFTPLAAFSSGYFADFSLVLRDGTQASVRLPIDRIEVVNHADADSLLFQLAAMQLIWEPGRWFDGVLLSTALAQLPVMQAPAGAPLPSAGVDYSAYFNAIGPLNIPEPGSLALVGAGLVMAMAAGRRRRRCPGPADPARRGRKGRMVPG